MCHLAASKMEDAWDRRIRRMSFRVRTIWARTAGVDARKNLATDRSWIHMMSETQAVEGRDGKSSGVLACVLEIAVRRWFCSTSRSSVLVFDYTH